MKLTPRDWLFIGLVALLCWGSYAGGRASISSPPKATRDQPPSARSQRPPSSAPRALLAEDLLENATARNIATIPFTELYDVLRAATPERLAKWAHELEQMPEGPRRTAAITTFYKSLIQVNPVAALSAVAQIKSKRIQEEAAQALLRTAPESLWGDLAVFFETVPFPRESWEDPIANWSRVDRGDCRDAAGTAAHGCVSRLL